MDNTESLIPKARRLLNSDLLLIICLIGIGTIYLTSLVDGQLWSGDFAQYIQHAVNLAEGRHYSDTHYLTNSVGFFVGPHNYPPVYPLLLTPVYWLKGMDLEAFKWVGDCMFIAALWLAIKCFQPRLKAHWLLPLLIMAFSPYIWSFRDHILSDFPFTFFCYLTLLLTLKFFEAEEKRPYTTSETIPRALLIGICCYLCLGTREIGVVAPLTFVAYDVICRRRVSLASTIVGVTFITLALIQKHLLSVSFVPEYIQDNLSQLIHQRSSENISHLRWVSLDPHAILRRIIGYRHALQDFWILFSDRNDLFQMILTKTSFNLTTLFALVGYLRCLRIKITALEIFLVGYIAVLLLFGAPATFRYLIPVFPLLIYYTFSGIQWLSQIFLKKNQWIIAGVYFLLTMSAFLTQMPLITYERYTKGVYHPQAQEMFDFIKSHTRPEDTIVFQKPRIMGLLTQRTSASYPNPERKIPNLLNAYFDAIEGDYYVSMNLADWMLPLENPQPPGPSFDLVFSNTYFAVFRYQPENSP